MPCSGSPGRGFHALRENCHRKVAGGGNLSAIQEVPASELINETAIGFAKGGAIKEPKFAEYVKTGSHKERAPSQKDWYFTRLASVLYRVYADGPLGTESLRTYYGGRKNRGVKPEKFRKASGKVVRSCLQELEKGGLIQKHKKGGREITAKGQSLLEKNAKELLKKKPKKESLVQA